MGCPAEVEIGDNLVFTVTTHDPDTGVLTDADAVPAYLIYEDETGTAIASGNMAKLDDANTTGFYSELIAATAANGYENGKTYSVYITATVDGDEGGICYGFKAVDKQARLNRNADLTESQRSAHTWQGNTFYVDPVNGNDVTGDGTRLLPYATIQAAHDDLVTDSNHDVIFLVAGAAGGATTHTVAAITTISKRYCFIRGPGRDFIWTRSGNGNTIEVTGDGIEISGCQIGTAGTGSGNGVTITDADFVAVRNCWILDTRGDGVRILRGTNCRVECCHFDGTGVAASGQGVHIVGTAGSSNDTIIHDCHFAATGGDSIFIEDGTTNDTEIHHCTFHNSVAWGINIGASSTDCQVHNCVFGNNASGDINDGGTTSIIVNNEQWAKAGTTRTTLDSDFTTTQKASINTEVVDVIRTDTATELGATPAASPDLHSMVQFVYMDARNKLTSTATASTISNDAGTAIGTSVDSDDLTTFTRGKMS